MGIMACNRRGCDGIMCYRFSYTFGYICDSCFKELVTLGPTMDIKEFMENGISYCEFEDNFEELLDGEFSMEKL